MPYHPRSNAAIALRLLSQFRGLIESISFKMGARYHLSLQDREDLVNAAKAKISTVKWRSVLQRGGNRPLENYCISTIQTSMAKELRRIKAAGLSGLSKGPKIGAFPQHEDSFHEPRAVFYDPTCITQRSDGGRVRPEDKHVDADSLTDKLAAQEMADRAQLLLSGTTWEVVKLAFGFDGGPSRTPPEIAEELDLSVSAVECALENALQRLRRSAWPR